MLLFRSFKKDLFEYWIFLLMLSSTLALPNANIGNVLIQQTQKVVSRMLTLNVLNSLFYCFYSYPDVIGRERSIIKLLSDQVNGESPELNLINSAHLGDKDQRMRDILFYDENNHISMNLKSKLEDLNRSSSTAEPKSIISKVSNVFGCSWNSSCDYNKPISTPKDYTEGSLLSVLKKYEEPLQIAILGMYIIFFAILMWYVFSYFILKREFVNQNDFFRSTMLPLEMTIFQVYYMAKSIFENISGEKLFNPPLYSFLILIHFNLLLLMIAVSIMGCRSYSKAKTISKFAELVCISLTMAIFLTDFSFVAFDNLKKIVLLLSLALLSGLVWIKKPSAAEK